ncbi:MAG: hypothetical protein LBL31_02720, partial [Spirochaetaceae bacterium]|nr:hypothetical protein [Spirochaetaceae bacterium]
EARSPKPEARSPKPEARSPKPEARSPKPEAEQLPLRGNCFGVCALRKLRCGKSGAAVVLKSCGYFSMAVQVMSSGKSVFAD